MKKIIMFLLLAVVFVSCSKSPEQKANKLIKEDLKKSLVKPDTYQAVETKIDSAFSPYADPEFIQLAIEFFDITIEMSKYQEEIENAKFTMNLYTPNSYLNDEYTKDKYNKEKEKYNNANSSFEKAKKRLEKKAASIREILNKEPKFIGFQAHHTYRANNNAGNTLMGRAYYIFDKDMKNILVSMPENDLFNTSDYSKLQAVIKQIENEQEYTEEIEEDEE
jgi:PBP1b-binding outer membrane lipoprotein LpoB